MVEDRILYTTKSMNVFVTSSLFSLSSFFLHCLFVVSLLSELHQSVLRTRTHVILTPPSLTVCSHVRYALFTPPTVFLPPVISLSHRNKPYRLTKLSLSLYVHLRIHHVSPLFRALTSSYCMLLHCSVHLCHRAVCYSTVFLSCCYAVFSS